MLLNQKRVKKYVHELKKRMSKGAMEELDRRVAVILTVASHNAGGKKTIIKSDVLLTR